MVFVESQLFCLDVVKLVHYHQGPDDQDDGGGKLEYHQGASQETALNAAFELTFQNAYGLEGGNKKSGVTACKESGQQSDNEHGKYHGRVVIVGHTQFFARQVVEEGQGKVDQHQGDEHGDNAQDQGFDEELSDQLAADGAQHFSHSHFLCPAGGTGGGKVHKIDAGDHQDEQRDSGKDIYIRNVAVFSIDTRKFDTASLPCVTLRTTEGIWHC